MGQGRFMKNYRVYILTSVAYLGSLLFGMFLKMHSYMILGLVH